MKYVPGWTELLIVAGVVAVMIPNYLLASWLRSVFGIGGLIGWGFGFFLVSGIIYLSLTRR